MLITKNSFCIPTDRTFFICGNIYKENSLNSHNQYEEKNKINRE